MLAAIGALVFAHELCRLLGYSAHFGAAAMRSAGAHVEDRPHMQGADRGMGIPGAPGAVSGEYLGQCIGVIGQMLQPIGRASCRERGCRYVSIRGVGVTIK